MPSGKVKKKCFIITLAKYRKSLIGALSRLKVLSFFITFVQNFMLNQPDSANCQHISGKRGNYCSIQVISTLNVSSS